jgi:2-succinyl-5-enolpyruvyl-6-hydroxy-3-cyclohexene-1-carboxylate synthase
MQSVYTRAQLFGMRADKVKGWQKYEEVLKKRIEAGNFHLIELYNAVVNIKTQGR